MQQYEEKVHIWVVFCFVFRNLSCVPALIHRLLPCRKKMELNAETRKLEITSAAYASKTKTTTVSDSRLAEMRAEIQAQYLGTDNIASNEDVTDIEGENSDMNALTLHGEVFPSVTSSIFACYCSFIMSCLSVCRCSVRIVKIQ